METLYCPACSQTVHRSATTCPACGAWQGRPTEPPERNPFKLVALCLLWALGFWFGALVLMGTTGERLGGSLLLASIGLSFILTARGKLPGTAKPGKPALP
jgi:hypothetical protein